MWIVGRVYINRIYNFYVQYVLGRKVMMYGLLVYIVYVRSDIQMLRYCDVVIYVIYCYYFKVIVSFI